MGPWRRLCNKTAPGGFLCRSNGKLVMQRLQMLLKKLVVFFLAPARMMVPLTMATKGVITIGISNGGCDRSGECYQERPKQLVFNALGGFAKFCIFHGDVPLYSEYG